MDIEPYKLNSQIIRETALRIINDFAKYGVDIIFSGMDDQAYQELTSQLIPVFDRIIASDKHLLMRILRDIDISEIKLSNTRRKFPQASLSSVISHLVVEREMQKVITRKLYSKRDD